MHYQPYKNAPIHICCYRNKLVFRVESFNAMKGLHEENVINVQHVLYERNQQIFVLHKQNLITGFYIFCDSNIWTYGTNEFWMIVEI